MAARIATRALRSSPGSVLRVAGAARGGHGPAPLVSGHIEPPFHRMPPTNREVSQPPRARRGARPPVASRRAAL